MHLSKIIFLLISIFFDIKLMANLSQYHPTVGIGVNNITLDSGSDFVYHPQIPSYIFLSANFVNFSFGLKVPDNSGAPKDRDRMNSKYLDYHFDYYNSQYSFDIYFQNYKGFIYEPSKELNLPPFNNSKLSMSHLGGDFYYVFSAEAYSLGTLMGKERNQKTSGGSWIASGGYHIYELNSPDNYTPPSLLSKYENLNSLEKVTTEHMTGTIGYGYNKLWEHWYSGFMYLIGGGPQRKIIDYSTYTINNVSLASELVIKTGFGYQTANLRIGIGITLQQTDVNVNSGTTLRFGCADSLLFFTYIPDL